MNLLNKCTDKEVKLMKNAGVYLEDKDYSSEELKRRIDEIEKGEAKYYTLEEDRKDLGLPEEDEKTKKKRQRELRKNIKYNEEIKRQFFTADKKEPA